MNWREKIADWLTGGALTEARSQWNLMGLMYNRSSMERTDLMVDMNAIRAATEGGKSGTARKINRMAREALADGPVRLAP